MQHAIEEGRGWNTLLQALYFVWYCDPAHLECKLIYTEPQIGLEMESKGNEPVDEKGNPAYSEKKYCRETIMGKAKQYW